VSESVLDHGYVPEEHAPDPVISHGDPTPPGKVGIWLFLASEIMFFAGILGSYIVLRSGWPALFEQQGRVLNKWLAGFNTLVLIFSSLTMALAVDAAQKQNRKRLITCLIATWLCALTFMVVKAVEYTDKFRHHTMVVKQADGAWAYDGHVHEHDGKRIIHGIGVHLQDAPVAGLPEFNIHFGGEEWIREYAVKAGLKGTGEKMEEKDYEITGPVVQDQNYGPSKNLFFSSYFTATGVHGLHVLGGMIPLGILSVQAMRRKIFPEATEYVGLYWHFVDLVWIFLFPLLYLI
jgi:cytochrome c oxidase subunit 3